MDTEEHSHLPRLAREDYRGLAVVHWVHTIADRSTGWLDAEFHHRFREILLHAAARRQFLCPAYCLMPDHLHLVWMGTRPATDLYLANRWLRREINHQLRGKDCRLQHQAYDRVLRPQERRRHAFESLVAYVLENPIRSGISNRSAYTGMVVPGYPSLRHSLLDHPDDWDPFWKIYQRELAP